MSSITVAMSIIMAFTQTKYIDKYPCFCYDIVRGTNGSPTHSCKEKGWGIS